MKRFKIKFDSANTVHYIPRIKLYHDHDLLILTSPSSNSAIDVSCPQAIATTLCPPIPEVTLRGTLCPVVVPDPHCPPLFWPQAKTSPSFVKAKQWWFPHPTFSKRVYCRYQQEFGDCKYSTWITVFPASTPPTSEGESVWFVFPFPSCE